MAMAKGGVFRTVWPNTLTPITRLFAIYIQVERRVDRVGPPGILAAVHTKRAGAHG